MKTTRLLAPFLFSCLMLPWAVSGSDLTLSLAGRWRLQLDRNDAGLNERWFERKLSGSIRLPGSLPQQGLGDPPSIHTRWTGGIQEPRWWENPIYAPYAKSNDFHFPFWLQPQRYYVGAAWYQREVTIPNAWAGKRVVLSLERPHWETRVWIDRKLIGTNQGLGTPHDFDLGLIAPGAHTLTIRVDNRLVVDVGHDSHSVTDHTQGNWNGIVGRLELQATPAVWIDDLQFHPSVADRSVRVQGRLGNISGTAGAGILSFSMTTTRAGQRTAGADAKLFRVDVAWGTNGGTFAARLSLGAQAPLWDEFEPQLHEVTAELEQSRHRVTTRFGLREIATQDTQFLINGRRTLFRGTLECAIFPKTGHPPTDVASWKRILKVAKAHGLNQMRFHSWCPPEAAFVAADELGFYYQVEVSSWANSSTSLGDAKPVDGWLYEEAGRMLRYYGNHPSFVLMPYGNEPGGQQHARWLATWVGFWKAADARRLYTSGAGWPQIPENQFHVLPDPRIQAWGAGLSSRINAKPPETTTDYRAYISQRSVPVISHEIGQWCVYPNFAEIKKYTGYLKPRNFEIFRDTLRRRHLDDLAEAFLHASGKLQTLCYKEEIESALRTPGMGGFQLLDLHDFPGQGTALVGVLDPFWEEKGYVTPAEYRRFCNPTVPLARLRKRVFTTDETPVFGLEVAHFGRAPLTNVWPVWRVTDARGRTGETSHEPHSFGPAEFLQGSGPVRNLPLGHVPIAKVTLNLQGLAAPAKYKLVFGLARRPDGTGVLSENDWDFWVYPPQVPAAVPPGVRIVHELDADAVARLDAGGKVLLLIAPARVKDDRLGKVALGFSSIFWNTAWTHRQPPHTLGLLCDPQHPLFAGFPTDSHSNWQWWYLVSRAGALILDDLPAGVRPLVLVIDDWVTNRRLGLLFEAKVGAGRLVVCSIDLETNLETNLVARQFRRSLLDYMASDRFRPKQTVTAQQIRGLFAAPAVFAPSAANQPTAE